MYTYITACGYADQYNTTIVNVHCEAYTDMDHLDCLSADQLDDEDTSYWWDSSYTAPRTVNTKNKNTGHV